MIKIWKRRATKEEQTILKSFQPTTWKRIEKGIGCGTMIIAILLIPLLVFEHKYETSSEMELTILIPLIIVVVLLTYWIEKKIYGGEGYEGLDNSKIIEIHCQCKRVAMLGDPEDIGNGYFIEVENDKTLFLMAQDFYEIEFPNTHFKIIMTEEWRIIIEIEMMGESFESEIILKAPSMKEWSGDFFPKNGDIINKSLDQIIIERQNITP